MTHHPEGGPDRSPTKDYKSVGLVVRDLRQRSHFDETFRDSSRLTATLMSPKLLRYSTYRLGVALLLSMPAARAAAAVANAPSVAPAPIVDKPLPPAGNDTPGDQPSPQHVWVPGHWRWSEGAYVWETGRWEVPPASNMMWTAPQWQQSGNGFVLKEGYWDEAPPPPAPASATTTTVVQAPPQEIVVSTPPPPPQREIIYERPAPSYVWIQGYWAWRGGRHVWVAGHWEAPPRANLVWVPSRWELRGDRYVFVGGYWRDSAATVVTAPAPVVVGRARRT